MNAPETTIMIFGSRRGIVNVADVPSFIEAGIARAIDETKFPEGYAPKPAGVEPLPPEEQRNEILTAPDGSTLELSHQMRTSDPELYVKTCAEATSRRMVDPEPPAAAPTEAAGADSSPASSQGGIPLAPPSPSVAGRPKPASPRAGKPSPSPEG